MIRSFLFIPGDSDKKLAKGDASGADALILDLEDAVAPMAKEAARERVASHLAARPKGSRAPQLWVRINPFDTGLTLGDLAAVMPHAPDGIVQPKTDGPACVARLSHYLDALEAASGLAAGSTAILPVATETPRAVLTLGDFAGADLPRLYGLSWGAEDLATALGATGNRDADGRFGDTFRLARSQMLLAAKSAGVAAIDTLHADFRDEAGLVASSRAARAEGFSGRLAIHPAQVAPINQAFMPDAAEVLHAERVLAAFAAAGDAGTVGLDGKMLDVPHRKQAENIIALARAFGVGDDAR